MIQIVVGPISDKMGRRPVMMASLVLFLLATLGCIFATTAEGFLAFRMAQAVVATCMVLSRAAVRDMYEGPKAASMIGYVTMGMTVVPMMGPALGGILDQAFGWHANFWLLFAAAAVTLAIFYADFGETATLKYPLDLVSLHQIYLVSFSFLQIKKQRFLQKVT